MIWVMTILDLEIQIDILVSNQDIFIKIQLNNLKKSSSVAGESVGWYDGTL